MCFCLCLPAAPTNCYSDKSCFITKKRTFSPLYSSLCPGPISIYLYVSLPNPISLFLICYVFDCLSPICIRHLLKQNATMQHITVCHAGMLMYNKTHRLDLQLHTCIKQLLHTPPPPPPPPKTQIPKQSIRMQIMAVGHASMMTYIETHCSGNYSACINHLLHPSKKRHKCGGVSC